MTVPSCEPRSGGAGSSNDNNSNTNGTESFSPRDAGERFDQFQQ